jgi:hypothetical protein
MRRTVTHVDIRTIRRMSGDAGPRQTSDRYLYVTSLRRCPTSAALRKERSGHLTNLEPWDVRGHAR